MGMCVGLLISCIESWNGRLPTNKMDAAYEKCEELKQYKNVYIGHGRIREFCLRNTDVNYMPPKRQSGTAFLTLSESLFVKWVLQFLVYSGGGVAIRNMSPLFERHPLLK